MVTKSDKDYPLINQNSLSNDLLDYNIFFEFIVRRKKFICFFTAVGMILFGIIALSQKRTWQGSFQIVLEGKELQQNSLGKLTPNISKAIGLKKGPTNLETEVGIISSPSILMDIFKYVQNKKLAEDNSYQRIGFNSWRNNQLNIKLKNDTSILNIDYKDKNKDIILPVLEKISNTYQDYSSKNRRREIELSEKYYNEQIEIFKEKSIQSLKKAQQFAQDQDLSILRNDSDMDEEIINNINIEALRVKTANEIRYIDAQLEKIELMSGNDEEIAYQASIIPALQNEGSLAALKNIELKLYDLRNSYKEDDISIQKVLKQRSLLLQSLKKRTTGILKAKRIDAESILRSTERPKGVLIKYESLLREALKDKLTLDELENEYRALKLEKSKYLDPWQLITQPTLLPVPIAPSRKGYVAFGLLIGLVFGNFLAYLFEKKSGLIFSKTIMKKLNQYPYLDTIDLNNVIKAKTALQILSKSSVFEKNKNITFLVIGKIKTKNQNYIKSVLQNDKKNNLFFNTEKLGDALDFENIILITQIGITQEAELIEVQRILSFHKINCLGMIIIDDVEISKNLSFFNLFKKNIFIK